MAVITDSFNVQYNKVPDGRPYLHGFVWLSLRSPSTYNTTKYQTAAPIYMGLYGCHYGFLQRTIQQSTRRPPLSTWVCMAVITDSFNVQYNKVPDGRPYLHGFVWLSLWIPSTYNTTKYQTAAPIYMGLYGCHYGFLQRTIQQSTRRPPLSTWVCMAVITDSFNVQYNKVPDGRPYLHGFVWLSLRIPATYNTTKYQMTAPIYTGCIDRPYLHGFVWLPLRIPSTYNTTKYQMAAPIYMGLYGCHYGFLQRTIQQSTRWPPLSTWVCMAAITDSYTVIWQRKWTLHLSV